MAFADPGDGRKILDSGRGTQPGEVTLAEACKLGDVLGYSSGWKRALATTGSVIQGRVVALKKGASGDVIPVSANPVVGGYTGATPGGYVYVAEGTDSGEIEAPPAGGWAVPLVVGLAGLALVLILWWVSARRPADQPEPRL